MKVNLQGAVRALSKNLNFLQPIYEAISNSLEANANEIIIDVNYDYSPDFLNSKNQKINGFTIIDNGEGFTKKNRTSFLTLWSQEKMHLGCKGSGRITWLAVYDTIKIMSQIVDEKNQVDMLFNLKFEEKNIQESKLANNILTNKTIIKFQYINDKYQNSSERNYNLNQLLDEIRNHFALKLFLLDKENKTFFIRLRDNEKEVEINNTNILQFENKVFTLIDNITKKEYEFSFYYCFMHNNKSMATLGYCANNRLVEKEEKDLFKLHNKDSYYILIVSNYLNEMVDENRSQFNNIMYQKEERIDVPFSIEQIKKEVLKQLELLIFERYPELKGLNEQEIQKSIKEAPYLIEYISKNEDTIKNKKKILEQAKKLFEKDKIEVKSEFENLLKSKNIETKEFNNALNNLSSIAAAELGEYILYRENIIKALSAAIKDKEKKEEFIHNIFMPKGKTTLNDINNQHLLSNMWILDDKFMTFTYAASDSTINRIIQDILKENEKRNMGNKKPDLTILFNKETNKDAIVIEFKGANAPLGQKETSIGEIGRNVNLIKKNLPDVNMIWGYIITTIDDEFAFSLESNAYIKLFTNSNEGKVFYQYNPNAMAHLFVLDLEAIVDDALARNSTFLNILKNNEKHS